MTRMMENPEQFAEAAVTRLLEQSPGVAVPADFAVRVRSALPAAAPARRRVGAGQAAALVFALVIAVALFVMAPHARPSVQSFMFWMEMLLIVELGGIAYWLGVKRGSFS